MNAAKTPHQVSLVKLQYKTDSLSLLLSIY